MLKVTQVLCSDPYNGNVAMQCCVKNNELSD